VRSSDGSEIEVKKKGVRDLGVEILEQMIMSQDRVNITDIALLGPT
jgi:hypothetical protein